MTIEKGPGDIKGYPSGKGKTLKKMPDGNPYPYEQGEMASDGVSEPEVVEGSNLEPKYKPSNSGNEGDSGLGGSGK